MPSPPPAGSEATPLPADPITSPLIEESSVWTTRPFETRLASSQISIVAGAVAVAATEPVSV
jgi:hypothetical protein